MYQIDNTINTTGYYYHGISIVQRHTIFKLNNYSMIQKSSLCVDGLFNKNKIDQITHKKKIK